MLKYFALGTVIVLAVQLATADDCSVASPDCATYMSAMKAKGMEIARDGMAIQMTEAAAPKSTAPDVLAAFCTNLKMIVACKQGFHAQCADFVDPNGPMTEDMKKMQQQLFAKAQTLCAAS